VVSWQVLRLHARRYDEARQPMLSLYPSGASQLNRYALDLLGSPETVVVYIDLEKRRFAIARACAGMPHARALMRTGNCTRPVSLGVHALRRAFQIEVRATRHFPLSFQAGWLVGSVPEEETS
jgi:hypothetical protein